MRVAVYARYSSDLQRQASIADQLRECQEHSERHGWTIVAEFTDSAISGATMLRPGLQALLHAVRDGRCDLVVAEGMDRLSRDLADTATILKRLRFAGVGLHTILEGDVGTMHIGLKGTMNELYLAELAVRTHRGQEGRILEGKSVAGLPYGYRAATGRPGDRDVHEAEASVVRRIYKSFIEGISPKRIARTLNAEGVHGPRGVAWSPSTIHGHAGRGTGILNNELYVGRLVWNRQRFVKDPDTGKRIARLNPRERWKVVDVPHLRIIDDATWDTVKAHQARARQLHRNDLRRPRHLFSGLTKCASCGGGFTVVNHDNLFCFNARERGTCTNGRRIKRQELEARVLRAMREQLLDPAAYEDFRDGWKEEWARLRREHLAQHTAAQRELPAVERRIREIVNAIGDGFRSEALKVELTQLEQRRATLVAAPQMPDIPAPPPANLSRVFRETVARLAESLTGEGVRHALRSYIDRIVIPPAGLLTVFGNPAAMGLQPGAMVGCGGPLPTTPPELIQAAA